MSEIMNKKMNQEENHEMNQGMNKEKKEPVLVVLAAGMGSRYGGLKQLDPVDAEGHVILDFSVYDAKRAGFKKVVFIIKHAIEQAFVETIGRRMAGTMEVAYAFQELDCLPEGYEIPEGRQKPYGTGHAVLCCKDLIDGPFAVINADDYYGVEAFSLLYNYLTSHEDDEKYRYCMVGFHIENTITENGYVSRGICQTDADSHLTEIVERTRIEKVNGGAAYTLDDGASWTAVPDGTPVSMNCWGFSRSFLDALEEKFPAFLDEGFKENPVKCEYFLPSVVEELLDENRAVVEVLETDDKWYGVTYPEDKASVTEAITAMKGSIYPNYLWK